MFRTTGGDKTQTNLQQFQLNSEIGSGEISLQFLTAGRCSAGMYDWICAEDVSDYVENWPAGQGCWVKDGDFPEEPVLIGVGNAVQLDMGSDYEGSGLTCSGQVSDEDLSFTARNNYNYVGNPYLCHVFPREKSFAVGCYDCA